jgi:hypothetical protein
MVFQSEQSIPVYVSAKGSHKHKVSVVGQRDFYLWGMYPAEQKISIDKELADEGLLSAANVRIKENVSSMQLLKSIISFGLYMPVSFEVSAFGIKAVDE